MRLAKLAVSLFLLLASTFAYGEGVWSSRDPRTNEFFAQMYALQQERFWYQRASQTITTERSRFDRTSRFEDLLRFRFEHRDKVKGYFTVSEDGMLEFRGHWDFWF